DGLAVAVFVDGDVEQKTGGGECVFGVHDQSVLGGQVDSFANARPADDPGDVAAAHVIGAVRIARAAVIGSDDDDGFFPEARAALRPRALASSKIVGTEG